MKVYAVGGMVRDALMGLSYSDQDFVVVGARPEELVAQGFIPVGRDFPVFLHPKTKNSYALARTERKQGVGHQGFVFYSAPDVSLEDDLVRRDLTINAIARDLANGALVDPYGGANDIAAKILRHVSPAFVEDPLRVLRVARFAARFSDFRVAKETMSLMQSMVAEGTLATLSAERVWQELSRGLVMPMPSRMFEVLAQCGALSALWPWLASGWSALQPYQQKQLDRPLATIGAADYPQEGEEMLLAQQFAVVCLLAYSSGDGAAWSENTTVADAMAADFTAQRLPLLVKRSAESALTLLPHLQKGLATVSAEQLLEWWFRIDGLRSRQRFCIVLSVWQRFLPQYDFAQWLSWRDGVVQIPFPKENPDSRTPQQKAAQMYDLRLQYLADCVKSAL